MGQSREVPGKGQWYLIARHGDMVMRVRPRMLLGETASGELSFEASCAQLELDIDDDGGLVLSAVDGHELEWAGGTRCSRERLARHRGAEIRLAHNVLILDTDFVEDVPVPRPVEDPKSPNTARVTERPRARPAAPVPEVASPAPKTQPQATVEERSKVPVQRTRARRPRTPSPSMAAVMALSAISLGLLYFGFRDDTAPSPDATVGGEPTPQVASPQAAAEVATSSEHALDDVLPSTAVPSPPQPQPLPPRDEPPSIEPKGPAQVPTLTVDAHEASPAVSEPEPAAVPADPVVPRVERPSVSVVAQTTVVGEPVSAAKTTNASKVDTGAMRAPPQSVAPTRTQASEVARRRALSAADRALEQGRLTTPPEANAYTLYNRVLALDPESQEARNGLKSVREKLINRALAELAGNALDDARRSLESAAEIGADPSLVANLQNEVAYRQQLINARKDNE